MHQLFSSNRKKMLKELAKLTKKLHKLYPTNYDLLIVQDLWQAQYQILSIILLKDS